MARLTRRPSGLRGFGVAICIATGLIFGAGAYTFHYAEGTSYLSNDPAACANCHVMNDYYAGWQKASHHHVATCNDCHVPHDVLRKYLVKADAGYRHSKAFTLEDFHEPIEMIDRSHRVLTANCVACHREAVHELTANAAAFGEAHDCLHCHRSVGHGPVR